MVKSLLIKDTPLKKGVRERKQSNNKQPSFRQAQRAATVQQLNK